MKYVTYSFLFVMILSVTGEVFAKDSLKEALAHSSAGMEIQSKRLRMVAENIANINSTGFTPGAKPYRRKVMTLRNKKDKDTGMDKVGVHQYKHDNAPFNERYDPTHPAANEKGIVLMPNVNVLIEMQDMREAQKSYEADVTMVGIAQSMMSQTMSLLNR